MWRKLFRGKREKSLSGPFIRGAREERGRKYEHVTPYQLAYGHSQPRYVYIEGKVIEKPRIITRIPPPITGEPHDHYTFFKIEENITIGYPGIATVREGETVRIYGKVSDKKQIIAEKIIGETGVYEIQL